MRRELETWEEEYHIDDHPAHKGEIVHSVAHKLYIEDCVLYHERVYKFYDRKDGGLIERHSLKVLAKV